MLLPGSARKGILINKVVARKHHEWRTLYVH